MTRISRVPSEPWSGEIILIRIAIGFTLIAASRTAAASTAPAALFTVTTPPLGTEDRYT
ncbi:hypothetical protein [Streptomyces sp. NPDC056982]|uniref:hypothetical protein n=1 Tax=Streptomyces sp. NPDC056982 TaxID=3345986 RepID=UPI0036309E39